MLYIYILYVMFTYVYVGGVGVWWSLYNICMHTWQKWRFGKCSLEFSRCIVVRWFTKYSGWANLVPATLLKKELHKCKLQWLYWNPSEYLGSLCLVRSVFSSGCVVAARFGGAPFEEWPAVFFCRHWKEGGYELPIPSREFPQLLGLP